MKQFLLKYKWPLTLVLAAVVVRLAYLIEISRQPELMVLLVDEKWHWLWAQDILDKSFWGDSAFFRAPLYAYVLAFAAKITGGSIFWCKTLQLVLTGGTAWFLCHLTENLFNRTAAAVAVRLVSGPESSVYLGLPTGRFSRPAACAPDSR